MEERVILVDKNDLEIGTEEKLQAHKQGKLHRSFGILVFNSKNELMLQKRHSSKYHSGGLWTNTCCSHPRPGEKTLEAAHRRLKEEMGFDCELKEAFTFSYNVKFDNGLYENEFYHIFIGYSEQEPKFNPEEAEDWKWMGLQDIATDMSKNPGSYTHWFKLTIPKAIAYLAATTKE